ncbi:hypothetical protein WISP_78363 [Willisornis vidua]|uniref:Uncharacterized protein n=1 Tax=Willisornis vidua TaxID=1566151 RepID=A0ABQ9D5M8_9PASS|nr:hypothetical protein WISP_78363 [Willisornis vidua]
MGLRLLTKILDRCMPLEYTAPSWALLLFNIFINDLDTGLQGILTKLADDKERVEAIDSLKGREALQRDLDKLEDWEITNHMKFDKGQFPKAEMDDSGTIKTF